jgi:hypothetical protein
MIELTDKTIDFLWTIENEGLGYCLRSYYGKNIQDDVDDEVILELWVKAYEPFMELSNYIQSLQSLIE